MESACRHASGDHESRRMGGPSPFQSPTPLQLPQGRRERARSSAASLNEADQTDTRRGRRRAEKVERFAGGGCQLPGRLQRRRKVRWCRGSLPIVRIDLFELFGNRSVDAPELGPVRLHGSEQLEPFRLGVRCPRFQFFLKRFIDELLERLAISRGNRFRVPKKSVGDFERGLHSTSKPYLWVPRKGRGVQPQCAGQLHLPRHQLGQLDHAIREAPFVVVPAEDLDKAIAHDLRDRRIERR